MFDIANSLIKSCHANALVSFTAAALVLSSTILETCLGVGLVHVPVAGFATTLALIVGVAIHSLKLQHIHLVMASWAAVAATAISVDVVASIPVFGQPRALANFAIIIFHNVAFPKLACWQDLFACPAFAMTILKINNNNNTADTVIQNNYGHSLIL